MKLPSVKDLSVSGKRVLLRANLDVPLIGAKVADDTRIEKSLTTIKYLLEQKARVIIISHLGRPKGKEKVELSLQPVAKKIADLLNEKMSLVKEMVKGDKLIMLENLRFNPGEETNDQDFAKGLVELADFYINDAFAASHRQHASIIGLPQLFPASRRGFGFDFLNEVRILSKIKDNPARPLVIILGGAKEDKLEMKKKLSSWGDYFLVGGRLAAGLTSDSKDISQETIRKFKKIINQAKTIVWAGPMGVFEKKDSEKGTREIARAVVQSQAYTVVGGGDTEMALTKFGLTDKINYISSGGGAMLAFLAEGTLPGIEAMKGLNK